MDNMTAAITEELWAVLKAFYGAEVMDNTRVGVMG